MSLLSRLERGKDREKDRDREREREKDRIRIEKPIVEIRQTLNPPQITDPWRELKSIIHKETIKNIQIDNVDPEEIEPVVQKVSKMTAFQRSWSTVRTRFMLNVME
jgi:pilus assembly protein CpaF